MVNIAYAIKNKYTQILEYNPRRTVSYFGIGGTIAMKPLSEGPQEFYSAKEMLDRVPDYDNIANIRKAKTLSNLDSVNIGISEIAYICKLLHTELIEGTDAIVVSVGTDNLDWIASATTFMLPNLGKPIIYVSSMTRPDEPGSEARRNLTLALRAATAPIGGVYNVFGDELQKGCRIQKMQTRIKNPFESPHYPVGHIENDFLGYRNGHVDIQEDAINSNYNPDSVPELDPLMHKIHLYDVRESDPGEFNASVELNRTEFLRRKATVLETFPSGNIPASLIPEIRRFIAEDGHTFVLASGNPGAIVTPKYEGIKEVIDTGGLSAYDMTLPATRAKISWVMAHVDDPEHNPDRVKEKFFKVQADEMSLYPEIEQYQ